MVSRRMIGGVLAFLGGALVMIPTFLNVGLLLKVHSEPEVVIQWILNFYPVVLFALIGGFLGITGKSSGGPFGLIAGMTAILLPFLGYITGNVFIAGIFTQYSEIHGFAAAYNYSGYLILLKGGAQQLGITIESVLILAGGVLMLTDTSNK